MTWKQIQSWKSFPPPKKKFDIILYPFVVFVYIFVENLPILGF